MTEQLSPKQLHSIALSLCGWKSVGIAEELEITPQTLSRWKSDPTYKAVLNDNKMRILEAARQKLQVSAENAVFGLVEIAEEAENEEVRRKACLNIIQLVGLSDPAKGLYAWGIGATTTQGVMEEELRQQYIRDLATPDHIWDFRRRSNEDAAEE
jgi:hypothetical protein